GKLPGCSQMLLVDCLVRELHRLQHLASRRIADRQIQANVVVAIHIAAMRAHLARVLIGVCSTSRVRNSSSIGQTPVSSVGGQPCTGARARSSRSVQRSLRVSDQEPTRLRTANEELRAQLDQATDRACEAEERVSLLRTPLARE